MKNIYIIIMIYIIIRIKNYQDHADRLIDLNHVSSSIYLVDMANQKASESSVDELAEDPFFFFDLLFRRLFFRLRLGEPLLDEASSTVMSDVNSVPSLVVSLSESQTKYSSIA